MKLWQSFALVAVLLASSLSIRAQDDWKKIAPVGESFTVSMPTTAGSVSRVVPLSASDSVPTRVLFSISNGRRYMLVSFEKTTPDRTRALSSFDEFIKAMEWSLANFEGQPRSLDFDPASSDDSQMVRQYHLKLGDYNGVVRLLGREKTFFAQVIIGADANDPDTKRFLTSLRFGSTNNDDEPKVSNVYALSGPANTDLPPEPWPKSFSPISGGVLNGKALKLSRPEYPSAARENYDQGQVRVQIVIDEYGKVISARALSGPATLREAAVNAAFKSRFTPTRLMGQPVKISGIIIYNFVAQ